MNIQATLALTLTSTEAITLGNSTQNFPLTVGTSQPWGNGTGAGQVDLHCELAGQTLAAGASTTFTLSALTDSLGRTIAFAKVRALALVVTSRTAGDSLLVGDPTGSVAHAWAAPFDGSATGKARVYDAWALAAGPADGYAVGAGTSDQLVVKNTGSHAITFSLGLAGTSV